jgi:hypothetical protein
VLVAEPSVVLHGINSQPNSFLQVDSQVSLASSIQALRRECSWSLPLHRKLHGYPLRRRVEPSGKQDAVQVLVAASQKSRSPWHTVEPHEQGYSSLNPDLSLFEQVARGHSSQPVLDISLSDDQSIVFVGTKNEGTALPEYVSPLERM